MLDRGRGHIVFIASAVGKVGPGYTEPYAAIEAGLVALARSLRAEYAKAPIGFTSWRRARWGACSSVRGAH